MSLQWLISLAAVICLGQLVALPSPGMHFLQIQNPDGPISNDFIFHTQ